MTDQTDVAASPGIERNGTNPVPEAERRGLSRDLFAVWFSWNVSIMGISYGIYVFGLGLSVPQAIVAGVIAVGGPRTGLPTLTQTRFAFGFHGNKLPTLFAYLSNVGWKITIITLASATGAGLFARLWPAQFARPDGHASTAAVLLWFVAVLAVVLVVAVFGHQLILRVERWIAYLTAVMTVVFIGLIVPHVRWGELGSAAHGSWWAFGGGVIMAMTISGISFLNYGGDFARYLPRFTPARAVIGWTAGGITVPLAVLLVLGVLLVAGDAQLGNAAAADPIGALTALLPLWFFIPFSLVIVISLVAAAILGVYSSGLALLAMGVPTSRAGTTAINTVIISAGAFYLLFVSDSFLATFQAFLALVAVPMGTMGGIQLLDFIRQRRLRWDVTMAEPPARGGRRVRWTALGSLVVATVIGLGTVTSGDPNIARVVGFLLSEDAAKGVVGQTNVGVVLAMLVGAGVYALLTFGFKIDDGSARPASSARGRAAASSRP